MPTDFTGTASPLFSRLVSLLTDPLDFTRQAAGVALRPYQAAIFPPLLDSICNHTGDTFILVLPRQSGKDESLLNLLAFLLYSYASLDVGTVVVNPTYHPQTQRALQRFDLLLDRNRLTRSRWRKSGRFTRVLGRARVSFLSGDSNSNVVGDTASLLLIVNEAQDLRPARYYSKFLPMTASTNATRLLAGTIWTGDSLLSREIRLARQAEGRDGRQRVFMVDAEGVGAVLPPYAEHVRQVVRDHGRQHPFVKTQYFNEELDAQSSLFPPARLALIRSLPPFSPKMGGAGGGPEKMGAAAGGPEKMEAAAGGSGEGCSAPIAFLLDVAGQDESLISASSGLLLDRDPSLANAARDSVALTIVAVDLSTLELLKGPTYRVLERRSWTGLNHLTVFGQLKALGESWRPGHIVIDATGVGEGLWTLLEREYPGRVTPVKYSSVVKSDIGYRFLSIIESGRFRDTVPEQRVDDQYRACQAEILPGPAKLLHWSVPDGARNSFGELIHDDHLMADSLVAVLDRMEWFVSFPSVIIQRDIQAEIDGLGSSRLLPGFSVLFNERY